MSKVLKIWARKVLFGSNPPRELPRDPLPGLDIPQALPKPPVPYKPAQPEIRVEALDATYERFLGRKPKNLPPKSRKHDPNWPDSMRGTP